ncbi:MAG: hypothetical protein KME17_07205 [Cyanosarcina radialis HA8281-LM2]|jgi:hypothetical protein|nr:hypothetical protein [Cyanosarcina radialis HA8281-LM2]
MSSESSVASPSHSINPILRAALGSLDIQLEEELARYQRQRLENEATPLPDWENRQVTQPLESMGNATGSYGSAGNDSQEISSSAGMLSLTTMVPGALSATNFETQPQTLQNFTQVPVINPTEIPSPSVQPTISQQPAVGGSALVPTQPEPTSPNDYLSSSEELLRSLAKEEAKNQQKNSLLDTLLTPWAMASILLLLLASGAIAYILQNPSFLNAGGTSGSGQSTAPTGNQNAGGTNIAANRSSAPPIPDAPNLATEENFSELNLGNLGGLDPVSPQSPVPNRTAVTQRVAPQTNPRPATNSNPQNLVGALLPSDQQPVVTSAPAPQSVPNRPSSAPPAAPVIEFSTSSARSTPNPDRQGREFFFVMADYTDESSLIRARKIAPDALPVQLSEGKKVQIATFFRESKAQASVERLRRQGIEARVYYSP